MKDKEVRAYRAGREGGILRNHALVRSTRSARRCCLEEASKASGAELRQPPRDPSMGTICGRGSAGEKKTCQFVCVSVCRVSVFFVSRLHATWQACQYANLIKEGSRHDLVVREAVKLRTQFGRIA